MTEADPLEEEEEEAGVAVPEEVVASTKKVRSTQVMLSSVPSARICNEMDSK